MKQTQIKDYSNYLLYENGTIYNTATKKYLKGSIGENGYRYYRLSKNGAKKMFYEHRLVAEYFIDNPNDLPIVNHIDGNKLNNQISNLEWVNYSDNSKHWHKNSNIKSHQPTEYYTEDLQEEIWKEFSNYLISSKGRVRHKIKNNLLRPSITCGYYKVRLSKNGMVQDFMIHKLVYMLFFDDNELEGYVIDHIDGNKLNNSIENLRKVSNSENVLSALYETKTNQSTKKVTQYNLDGKPIKTYESARAAARELSLDASTISKVCRGKNKTHGGFIFKYLEDK